MDRETFV